MKPPSLIGASHVALTAPLPEPVADEFAGASASPRGVAVATSLADPAPTSVTARTRTSWATPFVIVTRSFVVTMAEVDVEYVLAMAVCHSPPDTRTSMR